MDEDTSILTRPGRAPDHTITYGSLADQTADLYVALDGASRPLLVFLHGGFWKPEYDRAHLACCASALAENGWSVLIPEYRRIPGAPDRTTHDVQSAVAAALKLCVAGAPNAQPVHNGKLLLAGHSAGGHLALWLAATAPPTGLMGVLGLAPVTDLLRAEALNLGSNAVARFLGQGANQRSDLNPICLPAINVPTVLVHGEQDATVPIELARLYAQRFTKVRLRAVPQCGHFDLIDPRSAAWPSILAALQHLAVHATPA